MKQRAVLCMMLGIAATTLNYLWAEGPQPEELMILSVRLYRSEESPSGWTEYLLAQPKVAKLFSAWGLSRAETPRERELAHPRVATPIGSPFSCYSGTSIRSRTGGANLLAGTGLDGKLTERSDGRVHLTMKLSRGSYRDRPDNIDAQFARTEVIEIQCLLEPGVVKRIYCDDSETCEVRVEKLK